jgi:hypothetical protein
MPRPLDSYPTSWGSSRASVFPHVGPASYAQVTYGPLAGGAVVEDVEGGLKYFDFLAGGATDSGNFQVVAIPTAATVGPGGQSRTYRLKYLAMRTATIGGEDQTAGSEAVAGTDLSGETVRLLGIASKS